ncbi:ring finger domain containing protein [Nitzschia inconspicua]|uniref:Ring finger domain containing protein n=1 Tax=Nitzschia inconspicua TaxID=303405 RepID=A0A9K3L648_9STRA|nr:ring finger domain containing protein [Nitzschia inconspicua]
MPQRAIPPIRPQPQLPESAVRRLNSLITDDLLDMIFTRGSNGPFSTKSSLRMYLLKMIYDPTFQMITIPILNGLALGPPHIHAQVKLQASQEEGYSLLYWACQWKFFRVKAYWPAESELIGMILKAGGVERVNNPLRNGANPLFFAVKYADLKGVDMLLDAGLTVDHRDAEGRTALKNALEHPQPPIIERLLEHLPATETITAYEIDTSSGLQTGNTFHINLIEWMVEQLYCDYTIVSWVNLGPPPPDNIIEAIHLMQKKGCHFSRESCRCFEILQTLFQDDVTSNFQWNAPEVAMVVGRALVGEKLPQRLQPNIANLKEELESNGESVNCPICLEHVRKEVTLYCGHTFCVNCIVRCAKNRSDCPLCRAKLCQDLCFRPGGSTTFSISNILGISHSFGRISVSKLTDEQIQLEAKFQGIYSPGIPIEKFRSLLEMDEENKYCHQNSTFTINGREMETETLVDLSAPVPVVRGNTTFLSPVLGRVCIEVTVQQVPVLAFIANQNVYTTVSKEFAETFHLKRIETLQSKKFVSVLDAKRVKNSTFTCLEPFVVNLRGIEVTLRNAIVQDPCPFPMYGIQLGMDFLASAAYCLIDVITYSGEDINVFSRVEKDRSWQVQGSSQETLRFYSHDEKSVHLPLLHFSPFGRDAFLGVSLRSDVKYDQCFWCCRLFPEGMAFCENCHAAGRKVTYCDSRCQNAAWRVHKRIIEATEPLAEVND